MDEPSLERAIAAARPRARGRDTVLASVRRQLFTAGAPAERIDRYVVREKLGAGGMGVVWAAFDPRLDRTVAIKLLRSDRRLAQHGRLLREAQALARLTHPNIVEVYDVGAHGDGIFIAMELVEGHTLASWLVLGPRSWRDVLAVFLEAGRGLQGAHAGGLVHRDFKPQNVMVSDDPGGVRPFGRVRVMDFGLAQAMRGSTECDAGPTMGSTIGGSHMWDRALTHTGERVGTPSYMAPEQHDGGTIDARTDQFGFCAALYEALVGVSPFCATTLARLAEDKRRGHIVPPRPRHGVPTRVLAVVRRGLEADPARRWPSMAALLGALESAGDGRRRVRATIAAAVAGIALVSIGASVGGAAPCEAAAAGVAMWNDERRGDVAAAFDRIEAGWVAGARVRTLAALDEHGNAWTRAAHQACKGPELTAADRDRARDCLQRDRQRFTALVDRFAAGDPEQMQHALEASLALTSPDACVDPRALAGTAAPPTNPELARRVAAVRDELAQIWALDRLGRYDVALTVADDVLRDPITQEHAPLLAETELARGDVLVELGQHEAGNAALAKAYFVALDSGEYRLAADAATLLVFSLGAYGARHDDAFDWSRHAESVLAHVPDEVMLRAELAINIGIVHAARGEIELAQAKYREAMAVLADQPRDHGDLASAMQYLAVSYVEEGRYAEARDLLTRVVEMREHSLGPDHGLVAVARANLANALTRAGDHEGALAEHARALDIRRLRFGADHPEVGVQHNNLGAVLAVMDEYEGAREQHSRALAIFEASLGSEHPYVGATLVNLGRVDIELARHDEAEVELERARTLLERVLGGRHPHVAYALLGLGELDVARAEPGRALDLLAQARTICGGGEPVLCAEIRFTEALAHTALGDPETALRIAAVARDEAGTGADADELRERIDARTAAWQAAAVVQ